MESSLVGGWCDGGGGSDEEDGGTAAAGGRGVHARGDGHSF